MRSACPCVDDIGVVDAGSPCHPAGEQGSAAVVDVVVVADDWGYPPCGESQSADLPVQVFDPR